MMSSAQPLISIVLPVYNGERYLAESIQSCLDQTYQNWELLVVDDASTDATAMIIAGYAARDRRIRSIRHNTNRQLPASLNTGFECAQGAYLTWTSDDNHYRPEALAAMLEALRGRPSADFVYADYSVIDEDGCAAHTIVVPPPNRFIQGYDAIPCFLYPRTLYEKLGDYAEDLFLAEDYEYWLRIYATGHSMYPLHRNLYEYRRHVGSLTTVRKSDAHAAAERALLRNLVALSHLNSTTRGAAYLHLASLASWRGDRARAVRYALSAVRYSPMRFVAQAIRYVERHLRQRPSHQSGTSGA